MIRSSRRLAATLGRARLRFNSCAADAAASSYPSTKATLAVRHVHTTGLAGIRRPGKAFASAGLLRRGNTAFGSYSRPSLPTVTSVFHAPLSRTQASEPSSPHQREDTAPISEASTYSLGLVARRIDRLLEKPISDADLRRLIARGASLSLYGLAITAFLGTLGVDTSALVAGISVGGVTLGFAARDIASNYIAGLMLIITRPFRSGEYVSIGKKSDCVTGIVDRIDMRYVYIRPDARSEELMLVPNSSVFNSVIITYNAPQQAAQDDQQAPSKADGNSAGARFGAESTSDAYKDVIRLSRSQLPALDEAELRRKHARTIASFDSQTDARVFLWLVHNPANVRTAEWQQFVETRGGPPDWARAVIAEDAAAE